MLAILRLGQSLSPTTGLDPTPDIDPCRHWAGPNRGYRTLSHASALGNRRPPLLSSFELYWNQIHLPTLIINLL
jgi:hypothetical protein